MPRIILLNKPYDVMCQFTDEGTGARTLAECVAVPDVYPAGRLDRDSEGLVVLTDDGGLIARISQPRYKLPKTYCVQVEGVPTDEALESLRRGIALKDGPTLPADVRAIAEPEWLWPRTPPVRFRQSIPTSWIEIVLREGRNRQVRRMTAAAGFPTLRLVRRAVGDWTLDGLSPGQWRDVSTPSPLTAARDAAPRPPQRTPHAAARRRPG